MPDEHNPFTDPWHSDAPAYSELVTAHTPPKFEPYAQAIIFYVASSEDSRAWIWPRGIERDGYHWFLFMFLEVEYFKEPTITILLRIPCVITVAQMQAGMTVSERSAFTFASVETDVEAMNRDGVLRLMDNSPDYDGPTLIKACRLVADPVFGEKIVSGAT